jgi:hypothetical protein
MTYGYERDGAFYSATMESVSGLRFGGNGEIITRGILIPIIRFRWILEEGSLW